MSVTIVTDGCDDDGDQSLGEDEEEEEKEADEEKDESRSGRRRARRRKGMWTRARAIRRMTRRSRPMMQPGFGQQLCVAPASRCAKPTVGALIQVGAGSLELLRLFAVAGRFP